MRTLPKCKWRRCVAIVTAIIGLGLSASAVSGGLALPAWQNIFNPDGTVQSKQANRGSNEALFMYDRLTLGQGIDNSTFVSGTTLEESIIDNGPVSITGDLGNAYVVSQFKKRTGMEMYVGIERMAEDGQFTVEFNQQLVYVTHGRPWPIYGWRVDGDLAVQITVSDEEITDAVVMVWQGGRYQVLIQSSVAGACVGDNTAFIACVGGPDFISEYKEIADSNSVPLGTMAEQLVEVGLNVDLTSGVSEGYTSILIHSDEDIVMSQFQKQGYWANY